MLAGHLGSGITGYPMLMGMVTDVRLGRDLLVLAIGCRCRPGELDGQDEQQKDGQPATHGPDCVLKRLNEGELALAVPVKSFAKQRCFALLEAVRPDPRFVSDRGSQGSEGHAPSLSARDT
mmetsp:Transcript_120536/g.335604  ORF Transcript_120536/g.335604 Transcript_120536/m.335604 type:complete len:121 (-) Transcript_120536:253-615(-)